MATKNDASVLAFEKNSSLLTVIYTVRHGEKMQHGQHPRL